MSTVYTILGIYCTYYMSSHHMQTVVRFDFVEATKCFRLPKISPSPTPTQYRFFVSNKLCTVTYLRFSFGLPDFPSLFGILLPIELCNLVSIKHIVHIICVTASISIEFKKTKIKSQIKLHFCCISLHTQQITVCTVRCFKFIFYFFLLYIFSVNFYFFFMFTSFGVLYVIKLQIKSYQFNAQLI